MTFGEPVGGRAVAVVAWKCLYNGAACLRLDREARERGALLVVTCDKHVRTEPLSELIELAISR